MYRFPPGLYSDVRIEDVSSTTIRMTLGTLEALTVRSFSAAFVRVFDGRRWYFSAVSDPSLVQRELDSLASVASPDPGIGSNPVVGRFQVNTGVHRVFDGKPVTAVESARKLSLLRESVSPLPGRSTVRYWQAYYMDNRKIKRIYSSKGADLEFDMQNAGIVGVFNLSEGDRRLFEFCHEAATSFEDLHGIEKPLEEKLGRCEEFMRHARPAEPGRTTVVLSPFAAGIFAHESFGHKSEADFMVGDEAMMREWAMGSRVGADMLSIVDDGSIPGTGYTPFDDEGTRASRTMLVTGGRLTGRLHSVATAAELGEEPTGNARSVGFEFQPIPRMTTTYIEPGSLTKSELFAGVDDGIFVEGVMHGSGLSTFTMAPSLAYRIRNGEQADPVSISVVTGNVMETLGMIDGLSDELELGTVAGGGCGKHEQHPLPVGFGGPYVRIRGMNVR